MEMTELGKEEGERTKEGEPSPPFLLFPQSSLTTSSFFSSVFCCYSLRIENSINAVTRSLCKLLP